MLVLIKGAGDLATGVALRLWSAGLDVVMTELAAPLAVRRTVSFCQAVYDGCQTVEGVTARRVTGPDDVVLTLAGGEIPLLVDPACDAARRLPLDGLIDAVMAKRNTGTAMADAPAVVALGPGFVAGVDCHAVVETQRGHDLGRLIIHGSAAPNTGVPGLVGGVGLERLLRAPCDGVFRGSAAIGDSVTAGQTVAWVDDRPVKVAISGVLRGLLPDGLTVPVGIKAGDVDPRASREHCFSVSDKARAVAGGALEGLLRFWAAGGRAVTLSARHV